MPSFHAVLPVPLMSLETSPAEPGGPSLHKLVEGALVANPYLSRRQLRFETAEGRVVLSGTVASYFQKQMAQEIVRRIDGVREVENCLEVNWRAPADAQFEGRLAE